MSRRPRLTIREKIAEVAVALFVPAVLTYVCAPDSIGGAIFTFGFFSLFALIAWGLCQDAR